MAIQGVIAEYTGFLEWLWRLDGTPCEVVDLTDMTVLHRREDGDADGPNACP